MVYNSASTMCECILTAIDLIKKKEEDFSAYINSGLFMSILDDFTRDIHNELPSILKTPYSAENNALLAYSTTFDDVLELNFRISMMVFDLRDQHNKLEAKVIFTNDTTERNFTFELEPVSNQLEIVGMRMVKTAFK